MSDTIIEFNQSAGELLTAAYQLEYFPIGIKFVKKKEKTFNLLQAKHKRPVCAHIKAAAEGESFYINGDCISCPGGLKWQGFPSPLTKMFFYKYFLGGVEKAKESPEIAEKCLDFLPEPPEVGLYDKLLFSPLKNCHFEPDVVVIITNPKHAYRLVVAAYLDEYHLVKTIPICAACHGSISIPFMTGELNTSMIDPIARDLGGYKDDAVLVGIPKPRFGSLVDNIKETPFGTRKEPIITDIFKKIIGFLAR